MHVMYFSVSRDGNNNYAVATIVFVVLPVIMILLVGKGWNDIENSVTLQLNKHAYIIQVRFMVIHTKLKFTQCLTMLLLFRQLCK